MAPTASSKSRFGGPSGVRSDGNGLAGTLRTNLNATNAAGGSRSGRGDPAAGDGGPSNGNHPTTTRSAPTSPSHSGRPAGGDAGAQRSAGVADLNSFRAR